MCWARPPVLQPSSPASASGACCSQRPCRPLAQGPLPPRAASFVNAFFPPFIFAMSCRDHSFFSLKHPHSCFDCSYPPTCC